MSQRIIVGLIPDTDVPSLKTALSQAGAESVRGPAPELPDVVIVTIPHDQELEEFIQRARKIPGVRYAEPDTWQFTM